MTTMFYIYTSELSGQQFVVEPHDDESYSVHAISYGPYVAWVAEGNTPVEWSPDAD